MVELERLLTARDIDFSALDNRIMCFPHIINICCQHLVDSFTNSELTDPVEDFVAAKPHGNPTSQTFAAGWTTAEEQMREVEEVEVDLLAALF